MADNLKKTKQIHIRVTEEEYNKLKELAKDRTISEYIINNTIGEFKLYNYNDLIKNLIEYNKNSSLFIKELNHIGVNINQIIHIMNIYNQKGIYYQNGEIDLINLLISTNENMNFLEEKILKISKSLIKK